VTFQEVILYWNLSVVKANTLVTEKLTRVSCYWLL